MSGLDIDTRSDIYSLGVLLYELLTGRPPFDAKELMAAGLDAMRRTIREQEPPKPSTRLTQELVAAPRQNAADSADNGGALPRRRYGQLKELIALVRGDLDWIVMKALEKDRVRRYETATGFAQDILRHLDSEPVVARPPSAAYRFRKFARRNKLPLAAAGVVTTALVVGLGLSVWSLTQERKARENEARMRRQAEAAEQKAQAEGNRANAQATEVRKALAASDFLQALRFIAEDKDHDALAYLVRSLKNNPTNEAAATRLATLLAYRTWPRPTLVIQHTGSVSSTQFSPDGKRVVTASDDSTARVWDAQTGQPLTEPLEHADKVRSAQFSPDGKLILTVSGDSTARVWDSQTGRPLAELPKHAFYVFSAEFSPDSKRLLTVTTNVARLWDVHTGQPLTEPLEHVDVVSSARFSPDGKLILTVSDGTARMWDSQTGQPLTEALKHAFGVSSAEFSPDGKRVLTASWDKTVRVWDAQTALPVIQSFKCDGSPVFAKFSPDGKLVLTVSVSKMDYTARVWDAQTGQPLTEPFNHCKSVSSAEFRPDGKRVVTVSWEGTVRVWDAQTAQPLTEPLQHAGYFNSAQFSPDSKRLVTASEDGAVRVWDVQTAQPLTEPLQHVTSAQFSPDSKRVVTASDDKTARVWDAQTGQPLTEPLKHGGSVFSAQFSPDGKRVVTASGDNTARVWDAQSGQPLTDPLKHADSSWIASSHFSLDGKRVVTASGDCGARVWDSQTGQPLTEPLKHGAGVYSAQFSPDGKRVVTASMDHTARVWDMTPPPRSYPAWLLSLAEALSAETLNSQGVLETSKLNQAEAVKQIRELLSREAEDDGWVTWGRWILAEPFDRTISPFSKITVRDWIERRIGDGTVPELGEAALLAAGNEGLLQRIAVARQRLEQIEQASTLQQKAVALKSQGKLTEAEAKYREAEATYRGIAAVASADGLNGLAWDLATSDNPESRDGKIAVFLAEKAVALTGRKSAPMLGTLAAAYAQNGEFEKAVRAQEEAIGLLQILRRTTMSPG